MKNGATCICALSLLNTLDEPMLERNWSAPDDPERLESRRAKAIA